MRFLRGLGIVLISVILIVLGIAAYIYVPKIIEKSKAEKEERLVVDFNHEVEKIQAETESLCEKYKLVSLDEPVDLPAEWEEDSIRMAQQMAPFFSQEDLREEAFLNAASKKPERLARTNQTAKQTWPVQRGKSGDDENETTRHSGPAVFNHAGFHLRMCQNR